MHYGQQLASIKSKVDPEVLCEGLPSVYARFTQYTRELEGNAEPDYDYYMEEFAKVCDDTNGGEWDVPLGVLEM